VCSKKGEAKFWNLGGQTRVAMAALDLTTGAATTWHPNPTDPIIQDGCALEVSGTTVYVGGWIYYLNGSLQSYIAGIMSGAVDVPVPPRKLVVALRIENLPNPFRTSTIITFALPSEAGVTLEVFDLAGRAVSTLSRNERTATGVHRVEFRRGVLPAGLYLCRLQAGPSTVTRKMLLLQ
jgi:hypothetical protein